MFEGGPALALPYYRKQRKRDFITEVLRFQSLITNVATQKLVLLKHKRHIRIFKNVLTMLWIAGVGAALVRGGRGCVGGTPCKWLAVLTANETAFLTLVPPSSFISSTSKSRADLYKVNQSRKIKGIFSMLHIT